MKKRIFYHIIFIFYLLNCVVCIAQEVELPLWEDPEGMVVTKLNLGFGKVDRAGWGGYSPNERAYFKEVLPAVFKRILSLDEMNGDRGIKWIFTGPRRGFYIEVRGSKMLFYTQYYDSYEFNDGREKIHAYPFSEADTIRFNFEGQIQAVCVEMDHKLGLYVRVNGKSVIHQIFMEDIYRNQLHLTGNDGTFTGRLFEPESRIERIKVNPDICYQKMLGWGGICTPTAYHELSEAGKGKWWEYIREYNLLCQREYPVGTLLNSSMDNWDDLSYAKAHYYGNNFPNGEVSDFNYNKRIQDLGGFIMFEFWDFPTWIGNDEMEYTRAMVGYCIEALNKTGKAPRILGVQNELDMPEDRIRRFVPALRRELDKAGFEEVQIHMHNAPRIRDAMQRVKKYTENPEVWNAIDYSASNMYDYQEHFTEPDDFDKVLLSWVDEIKSRPFLSTEICINARQYQTDSYRLALVMGQLYEKNLSIANAVLIAYCWTILNIEQPSFGATRSLFVSSPEDGFMPVPSSKQLRTFGAYSRRIKEGMIRVQVENKNEDVKVVAFKGEGNTGTMVILNRSLNPVDLEIDWQGMQFEEIEIADPYSPNIIKNIEGKLPRVEPGAFVTLTNVFIGNGK